MRTKVFFGAEPCESIRQASNLEAEVIYYGSLRSSGWLPLLKENEHARHFDTASHDRGPELLDPEFLLRLDAADVQMDVAHGHAGRVRRKELRHSRRRERCGR